MDEIIKDIIDSKRDYIIEFAVDEYLAADPNNSIITAFFDLIDELDTDLKILKSCGLSVEDIKKEFMDKAKQGIDFSGLEKSDKNETEHNNIIEMTNV